MLRYLVVAGIGICSLSLGCNSIPIQIPDPKASPGGDSGLEYHPDARTKADKDAGKGDLHTPWSDADTSGDCGTADLLTTGDSRPDLLDDGHLGDGIADGPPTTDSQPASDTLLENE